MVKKIETEQNGLIKVGSREEPVVGMYAGTVAILAGGKTVWEDYEKLKELTRHQVICVNDIGLHFKGKIKHFVSLHIRWSPVVRIIRDMNMGPEKYYTHSIRYGEQVDYSWNLKSGGGTSSMFAVQVAHHLGYDRIILCGVPLDDSGHYFGSPYEKNQDFRTRIESWKEFGRRCPEAIEKVRSMSGNTKRMYGGIEDN